MKTCLPCSAQEVIGNQAIRMHLPTTADTRLPNRFHKLLPVGIVLEDGLAAITPVHHMIERAGIFDSEFASQS